jgi:hypothetical protein
MGRLCIILKGFLEKIMCECENWIHLAEDRDH